MECVKKMAEKDGRSHPEEIDLQRIASLPEGDRRPNTGQQQDRIEKKELGEDEIFKEVEGGFPGLVKAGLVDDSNRV